MKIIKASLMVGLVWVMTLSSPALGGEDVDCGNLEEAIQGYDPNPVSVSYESDLQELQVLVEQFFESCREDVAEEDYVVRPDLSPNQGDEIKCTRHDGKVATFIVTETGDSNNYGYWILQEAATPETLLDTNYRYDWRAGWANGLHQTVKGQYVRGWTNFNGDPHGSHGWTHKNEAGNTQHATTACGGFAVRGVVKFNQDSVNYLDAQYSGASYSWSTETGYYVTVSFDVKLRASWSITAALYLIGGGLQESRGFDVEFGVSKSETMKHSTTVTVSTTYHNTGGEFVHTGGGGIGQLTSGGGSWAVRPHT